MTSVITTACTPYINGETFFNYNQLSITEIDYLKLIDSITYTIFSDDGELLRVTY